MPSPFNPLKEVSSSPTVSHARAKRLGRGLGAAFASAASSPVVDVGGGPGSKELAISVCTVDGQIVSLGGSQSTRYPLMEAVLPLLFAIASTDCGLDEVAEVRNASRVGAGG